MEIDKKIIKKLVDALEDLKKSLKDSNVEINSQETAEVEIDNSKIVKSPIIGTAYLAPEPGAKKFVEVGKKIKKGDTIMIDQPYSLFQRYKCFLVYWMNQMGYQDCHKLTLL